MPPTATYEDIKAYQDKVEKDEITPHGLPPCPVCEAESRLFKIHAYRERRFLIIVEINGPSLRNPAPVPKKPA